MFILQKPSPSISILVKKKKTAPAEKEVGKYVSLDRRASNVREEEERGWGFIT